MSSRFSRRHVLRQLGVSAAALPFVGSLAGLHAAESPQRRRRRLVIMFSPNGVVPWNFWPEQAGPLKDLPISLEALTPFRDSTLIAQGVCNKVRGAGSAHMVGIGGLLTGCELMPGNRQGGGGPSAGWASGNSIDQEIAAYLQSQPHSRTRFGSLEFGVMVPERADVWTRMCYRAANQPATPVSNPYQMFQKLYGHVADRQLAGSVLDEVLEDLKRVKQHVAAEDRKLLDRHATFIREMEQDIQLARSEGAIGVKRPELEPGVSAEDVPRLSRMQIDLLVHGFAADFNRVATLQYSQATSPAQFSWLDIKETHHNLSHESDDNKKVQRQLTEITRWYCEQLAYLAQRLADTPEPNGDGSLLDNTLIVWTNELGKGNSHTRNDIPFVMVGGGLDWQMGRCLQLKHVAHNRLWLALANGFGHEIGEFGDPNFCGDGALTGLA